MRKWSIKLVCVGPNGQELPASFIEKVTYKLHPTFEKPTRGMDPCCGLREIDNSDQESAV
jgi:transcription initiation factor IIF auxiliary subunit